VFSEPNATPDESGTSGSDYEETQNAANAKRQELAGHGHPVSDTEVDDASLDRELEGLATKSDASSVSRRRRRRIKRGKQPVRSDDREQAPRDGGDNAGADGENHNVGGVDETVAVSDDDDDESVCDWKCVRGPLPDAGRQEARKFGKHIVREANKLARKYKKSRRDIMLAAGIGVRASRPDLAINTYRRWYSMHHPNKDGCESITSIY
jgi:hypothetical protein